MNVDLKEKIKSQLLRKDGKINTAIIRRDTFKQSVLYQEIKNATPCLSDSDDITLRERIFYIQNNLDTQIKCKVCKCKLNMKVTGDYPNTCFKCTRKYYKYKSCSATKKKNAKTLYNKLKSKYDNNQYELLDETTILQFIEERCKLTHYGEKHTFVNEKIKKNNVDMLLSILSYTEKYKKVDFDNISWSERFYLFTHKTPTPKCKSCKSEYVKYINIKLGYTNYCKNTCRHTYFMDTVNQEILNQDFELVSDTTGGLKGSTFSLKCKKCNKLVDRQLTNGRWKSIHCSGCFGEIGKSKGEKEVGSFIASLNLEFEENNKTIINPKELDIFIPSKNLAIEFNGIYWHCDFFLDKNYHLEKTNMCKEQGVQLIHILETEWNENADIVKSIIKSKLGIYDTRIFARQCKLKIVTKEHKKSFLNDNHIQGNDNSSIYYGLYYNDELVSLMSFGKRKICRSESEWELIRFCSKKNYQIVGSASKLLSHFEKENNIKKLKTYADLRYSFSPDFYLKLGFTLKHISKPNYWYSKNNTILHRVNFQKHKLSKKLQKFDPKLTEYENMVIDGYRRIWDCGNYVFYKEYEK